MALEQPAPSLDLPALHVSGTSSISRKVRGEPGLSSFCFRCLHLCDAEFHGEILNSDGEKAWEAHWLRVILRGIHGRSNRMDETQIPRHVVHRRRHRIGRPGNAGIFVEDCFAARGRFFARLRVNGRERGLGGRGGSSPATWRPCGRVSSSCDPFRWRMRSL